MYTDLHRSDISIPISVYLCSSVVELYSAATTGLRSVPSFSTLTSNTSPSLRNTGGLRNAPTPSGVPLAITSPGSSVIPCDRYETRYATLKIIFEVFDDCMTLPLSSPSIFSDCTSSISSRVVMNGPNGAKVSRPLPRDEIEEDRKSTRLNSSHVSISYAVFCLKKKKQIKQKRTLIT